MRARLRYRCRRGTKELDTVLLRFLDGGFERLSEAEQADFEAILAEQDPVLAGWLWGGQTPPERWRAIVARIRAASGITS